MLSHYCLIVISVGEAVASGDHWYIKRNFLQSVVAICFLLPLCLPKNMGILSYTR